MGLFERLGRRVEEFKREADTAKEDAATRRCRTCETFVYSDRETCPDCGSEDLVAVDRDG
ncbi:zinc ribbon domain-containing protein [Natrialbaceae archaeon GCM10025810]|uniref:zinc ribbon domain-containing protein n=1 Tax=Halovalidus salilacus TaxID=3075124 RepID=UPI003611523C